MKHKHITNLTLAGIGACLLLRTLQLLVLIDGETGFGKVGFTYSGLNIAVYVLTLLVAVGIVVLSSFFSKRQPVSAPDTTVSPALSVFSFLMAVFNLFTAGGFLLSGRGINNPYGSLYLLLLLLSALFFIFYGISGFGSVKCPKILSVAPLLLSGYELIEAFISYTGMANISDNVYECLFLCCLLFFFLLHGKVISSVDVRRSARVILPASWLTVFFGFLTAVPPLIVALLGGNSLLHHSPLDSIAALFPTIHALFFTSALYKK